MASEDDQVSGTEQRLRNWGEREVQIKVVRIEWTVSLSLGSCSRLVWWLQRMHRVVELPVVWLS